MKYVIPKRKYVYTVYPVKGANGIFILYKKIDVKKLKTSTCIN